jgi:hypothetical protein
MQIEELIALLFDVANAILQEFRNNPEQIGVEPIGTFDVNNHISDEYSAYL